MVAVKELLGRETSRAERLEQRLKFAREIRALTDLTGHNRILSCYGWAERGAVLWMIT
eukprot:gene36450-43941_t